MDSLSCLLPEIRHGDGKSTRVFLTTNTLKQKETRSVPGPFPVGTQQGPQATAGLQTAVPRAWGFPFSWSSLLLG